MTQEGDIEADDPLWGPLKGAVPVLCLEVQVKS